MVIPHEYENWPYTIARCTRWPCGVIKCILCVRAIGTYGVHCTGALELAPLGLIAFTMLYVYIFFFNKTP